MQILFTSFIIMYFVCMGDTYDNTKFKNMDIDEILRNDRLIQHYFKCLMDGKPCTPEGEELRKNLPEVIRSGCSQCTQEELIAARKVATKMRNDHTEMWNMFLDKYDPGALYRHKFAKELKQDGFGDFL
ncbi:hypothetical protein HHI36_003584 [Cryptolaemus montrouzieri]|uniref:Chemosensory protein n=1 Tax=Cryptolaemus montrouzieri TaxID=559131 RepID=A0ABD2PDV6_9CUCU